MDRAIRCWLGTTLLCIGVACASANTIETRLKLLHDYAASVNEARLVRGLPPLKLNDSLCEAAQTYAETLLKTGQIRHVDDQGRRADYRVATAGYFYHRLGENLAAGQISWERALEMWLQSPPHRANLLNADYRELGIGFTADDAAKYRTTWTQLLGARRHIYPVVINLDAFATDSPMVSVYVHGAREAQVMRYRIGEGASGAGQKANRVGRPTIRLVAFDEAFSKMDQQHIGSTLDLFQKFNLQVITATPLA